VPLVASAAIAHIIVKDFELALTTSIIIGAVPAVWVGARLSSKAPDGLIRPALVFVLLASALKLLEMPTVVLGLVLLIFALVALPVWGAFDAAAHPASQWEEAGLDRATWIRRLAWLAPVGVGFWFGLLYFAKARPRLVAAGDRMLAPPVPA
jgi:hypothetical protein